MQNDDIKVYLTDEQIENILNFINENFVDSDKYKTQLENSLKLSNYLKQNNYSVGEVESDKLLEKSPKLNHMFQIIYLADKLVKVSDFNNLSTLLEIYTINTGHEQIVDIDDYSSNKRYGNKGLDIIKVYITEINQFKLLTKEEEIECTLQGFEGRQKLVEHNLRLVLKVANKFKGYELAYEDIIQAGNEGLITAARKFDSTYQCRFSTYALWWIKQRIQREFAYSGRTIRVPYGLHDRIKKAKRILDSYRIENNGKELTDEELAQIMDITLQTVNDIRKCMELSKTSSYDKILESEKLELGEEIEDPNNCITEKTNNIFYQELSQCIDGIDKLNEKEKEVLKMRYGFYDRVYTLQEIGDMYNLTRERIRQIEEKALNKLRNNKKIQEFDENFALRMKK